MGVVSLAGLPPQFPGVPDSKELLRFITCGSVDDGKSSLIGRLLYESRLIFDDQISAIARDSKKHGTVGEELDLALLVDGLEAEREQGITIDVAYRFFTTPRRSFIVADTPGHEQFTRNMATGASTAELAILLIDARKGVLPQTKRHSIIASLLGIRSIVLAVNKIDLVGFSGATFHRIVSEYLTFAQGLEFLQITPIPLSARFGDNVTHLSERTPWYDGRTLIEHLETVAVRSDTAEQPFRFPVQWVNRPNQDFRGFAGSLASGQIAPGDRVIVAGSGKVSSVKSIVTFDGERALARSGDAVTLVLEDEIDIARGDVLTRPEDRTEVSDQFSAHLVWMDDHEMLPGRSYLLRLGTATVPARVTGLKHKIDINTLEQRPGRTLALNDIGVCNLATARPIAFDAYQNNRRTGAFILIDRTSNATVGAGMVQFGLRRATNIHRHEHMVEPEARARSLMQKPMVLWFTGLSGSGKSTIANLVEKALHENGLHTMLLDGDNIRHGLSRDLGFTDADRVENIRRVGEVSKLFVDAGLVVLCCFISPFAEERRMMRDMLGEDEFVEIFVDVPIEECIRRDPKGLYKRVMAGKITNFTGISSPFEVPQSPELHLKPMNMSAEEAARLVIGEVLSRQSRLLREAGRF
jgi:bifunctional enzyme CysN/CysC